MNEIRTSLLTAIKRDRNMFVRAKIDPMFDRVRPQVDALLEDIFQKTKANAEGQVSNAEFAVRGMKSWFDGDHASNDDVQKYNFIRDKISDAKDKIKTYSYGYFGYDDALRIMSEANELVDGIQANICRIKNSSETEFNRCTDELSDVSTKIKQLKKNRKLYTMIIIAAVELIIVSFSPVILLYQGLLFLLLLYALKEWYPNYIQKSSTIDLIILVYIISMVPSLIISLIRLEFGATVICIIFIAVPFILPHIFKSEDLSGLKHEQTELKKQTGVLKHRIDAAEESLI